MQKSITKYKSLHTVSMYEAEISLAQSFLDRARSLYGVFSQFDGYAVTVAEKDAPVSVDAAGAYFDGAAPTEFAEDESSPGKVGRPRKQELVRATYERVFPDGHASRSWKDVVQKVSEALGETISADTLKRSLGRSSQQPRRPKAEMSDEGNKQS